MKLAIGGMACSSCAGGEALCAAPSRPPLQVPLAPPWSAAKWRLAGWLAGWLITLCLPYAAHAVPRACPAPPSCSVLAGVELALLRVPGVAAASVSLTLEQAEVQYGEGLCTPQQLVAAVEAAGFEAGGEGAGRAWLLLF